VVTAPSAEGVPTRKASHRPSGDQAGEPGVFAVVVVPVVVVPVVVVPVVVCPVGIACSEAV
jgi:hypothetical protein